MLPRYKSNFRYLAYRLVCIAALCTWLAVWLLTVRGVISFRYFFLAMPLALVALFMSFNLAAFHFAYSIFGSLERTREPAEEPLATAKTTSGAVGWFQGTAPFFAWRLYPGGIAFSAVGIGSGFVPLALITRTKQQRWGGCTVWHTSEEVRSPLMVSAGTIYEPLLQLLRDREQQVIES